MKWLIFALVISTCARANELSEQRRQELLNLLEHDCGSCHGITFNGGLGPSLLSDALLNKSDEFLVHTILNGRPGTAMPPWKPFLTEREALWLVHKLKESQF